MKTNKKIIVFVTAMVLVFAMVTGATLAYLTSIANTVTNTFVSGGFGTVYLQEKDGGSTPVDPFTGTLTKNNSYTVIPGKAINKDPQVSLNMDDDKITDAYLYVKMTYGTNWTYDATNRKFTGKVNSRTSALSFTLADNWYVVDSATTGTIVLCYGSKDAGAKVTGDVDYTSIFKASNGATITVSTALTEADCEWFKTSANSALLKLAFSAYAIQSEGFTVTTGWDQAKTLG